MALQLIIDNTDHHNYIGNLLRAAHVATTQSVLPSDMRDLLLSMDVDNVERDLRTAVALRL